MVEKDYIDRHSLEKKVHTGMNIIEAMQAIIDAPAADVVEVRHGRWIRTDGIVHGIVSKVYSCSLCKRNAGVSENGFWYLSDYCPNCGAKMDGEE